MCQLCCMLYMPLKFIVPRIKLSFSQLVQCCDVETIKMPPTENTVQSLVKITLSYVSIMYICMK